jgi:hypothetical protein
MNIPLLDRSNYLKGLFITAKLDKQLTESEKDILKKFSDKLGFASDFYDETVRSLLSNKYLLEDPIIFSDPQIAKSFLVDAIKLACCNDLISTSEVEWLKKTAVINGIETTIVDVEIKNYSETAKYTLNSDFALFSII